MDENPDQNPISSQNPAPSPYSPPPIPEPKSGFKLPKSFILILTALIILAGGYFAYAKYQNLWPWQKSAPSPSVSAPDETADWKTYTNIKYNFAIKYPQDWQAETKNNDSFVQLSNIEIAKQYKEVAKKTATEGGAFNNGIFIDIFETDKTLNDFIQSLYNNPDSPHGNSIRSIKETEFPNGMNAVFVESNESGYGLDSAIILKNRNYAFRFTEYLGGNFGTEKYSEDTFNKILSTFKLIDETAGWKTYRNEKYGFEVKYPPEFQVEEGWNYSGSLQEEVTRFQEKVLTSQNPDTYGFVDSMFVKYYLGKLLSQQLEEASHQPPKFGNSAQVETILLNNGLKAYKVYTNIGLDDVLNYFVPISDKNVLLHFLGAPDGMIKSLNIYRQ